MNLLILKRLAARWSRRQRSLPGTPQLLRFWEKRAQTYGRRAVLNLGHGDAEVEAVTRQQRATIFPHLTRLLRGDERVALDFGCGPGRFTAHLAEAIHGHAIGVDPIQTLIELAPPRAGVEYLVSDGRRIPLPDASADIVWVCLVLGGLSDDQLAETVSELDRVLRSGGLLFLVENTSARENCPHWAFRSVKAYRRLVPFVPLAHLHDYDDLGECISIMAGRKASASP
jgi:ubiquinone/menaquinone biosynthesis C-methylase UbiE